MLLPHHADKLLEVAVDLDHASAWGVRSIESVAELPAYARRYGEDVLPVISFPWRSVNGLEVEQLCPDPERRPRDGDDELKYLWPSGVSTFMNQLRVVDQHGPVVVVEGTKQGLVVARLAPAEWTVLGIAGCYSWLTEGRGPDLEDLLSLDGREVVVLFDGDVSSNLDVWSAARDFIASAKTAGAKSVKIAKLWDLTRGNDGIDDALGRLKSDAQRSKVLAGLLARADAKLPPQPKKKVKAGDPLGKRPTVVSTDDRLVVIGQLSKLLVDNYGGETLFRHGSELATLGRDEHDRLELRTVTPAMLNELVTRVAYVVRETKMGLVPDYPDPTTTSILLSRFDDYSAVAGITPTPFLRDDGSVCIERGWDAASGMLASFDALAGLEVVEEPTREELEAAVALLRDDLLSIEGFDGPAAVAGAFALLLTPFVRHLVNVVPLAVVDGLQMGVGKNLLADVLSILWHGSPSAPTTFPHDGEEQRKAITGLMRAGRAIVVWDEAHEVGGRALAQLLTAETWQDRLLGSSTTVAYPNRGTYVSLGNNVTVLGDVARRVYFIRIAPATPNPELRPQDGFRHPDLKAWALEHRGELLRAVFILLRAWWAAGRPLRPATMGSFERWEGVVGGILEVAGVEGFLSDVAERREQSDWDTARWTAHLETLEELFGTRPFAVRDVQAAVIKLDPEQLPPAVDGIDESSKEFARVLGTAYRGVAGRWYGSRAIVRMGVVHKKVAGWRIVTPDSPTVDLPSTPDVGGSGGTVGSSLSSRVQERPSSEGDVILTDEAKCGPYGPSTPSDLVYAGVVPFDLETGGVEDLHRTELDPDAYAPPGHYVRLVSTVAGVHELDPKLVLDAVDAGIPIAAHNGFGFDFLALARRHGLDLLAASEAGLLVDTKLLAVLADPPAAKLGSKKARSFYGLDQTSRRLGHEGKVDDVKRLAKAHGGFGLIPLDDPDFIAYAAGDVSAMLPLLDAFELDDYARREMRVFGRIVSGVTLAGFRVDEQLLEQRLAAGAAVTAERLDWLRSEHGLPTTRKDGSETSAPHRTDDGIAAIDSAFRSFGIELPRTRSGRPKLDKGTLGDFRAELLEDGGHPELLALVEAVLELNGVRTVYGTVASHVVDGRTHSSVDAFQSSGRFSITDPGLTVLGKRGGRQLERDVYLADEGDLLVAFDLDQIDMRAVAGHSQDPAYIDVFRSGRDPHSEIAELVFGDVSRREDAKAIGHGYNYGRSIAAIIADGVDEELALRFDRQMREQFPRLVEWKEEVRHLAKVDGYLDNGFGRRMVAESGREHTQAPALMGQGGARDLMAECILRLPLELVPRLRAVVHDELVFSLPAGEVDEAAEAILASMTFEWRGVPIRAGRSVAAPSWGACYPPKAKP